jgi:catalase
MCTDDGNLDWLFFNEPRLPHSRWGEVPSFVHAQKDVPQSNLFATSAFWDFFNLNAEAYHALMMIIISGSRHPKS